MLGKWLTEANLRGNRLNRRALCATCIIDVSAQQRRKVVRQLKGVQSLDMSEAFKVLKLFSDRAAAVTSARLIPETPTFFRADAACFRDDHGQIRRRASDLILSYLILSESHAYCTYGKAPMRHDEESLPTEQA